MRRADERGLVETFNPLTRIRNRRLLQAIPQFPGYAVSGETDPPGNGAQEQQAASGAKLVYLRSQIAYESTVLPMAHHVVSPHSLQDVLRFHEVTSHRSGQIE